MRVRALPAATWREARYGLRAVRIGQASHPGPPDSGPAVAVSSDETFVIDDSDDGLAARRLRTLHAAAQMGLGPPPRHRRRIRIAGLDADRTESPHGDARSGVEDAPTAGDAASHAARGVLAAANLFHSLAGRIGNVAADAPIPLTLQRQRWSDVFIPIIWLQRGQRFHAQCWIG